MQTFRLDLTKAKIAGTVFLILCLLNLMSTFSSGIKKSFFFADDFLGLALFRDAEGLLDLEASAGRPITNVYFFFTTEIFGADGNSKFLITNFLVLILGLIFFVALEIKKGRNHLLGMIFAICLLITSGSFLPLIFWASNFNHIFSILLFSLILYIHQTNRLLQMNTIDHSSININALLMSHKA